MNEGSIGNDACRPVFILFFPEAHYTDGLWTLGHDACVLVRREHTGGGLVGKGVLEFPKDGGARGVPVTPQDDCKSQEPSSVRGAGLELLTELEVRGFQPTPRVLATSTITPRLRPRRYRFRDIIATSAKFWSSSSLGKQMLGHPRQQAMGSAVIPPRFVVCRQEALHWFPFVILEVMEGFSPPNQDLNVVWIAYEDGVTNVAVASHGGFTWTGAIRGTVPGPEIIGLAAYLLHTPP